ncbi:MAG: complex I subunit 1 family protein, partial [Chloroflexota bacterium]
MELFRDLFSILLFPGGLAVLVAGLAYSWIHRKALARLQSRVGPRWFQPLADVVKLLAKEEVVPHGAPQPLFSLLPVLALAGALTAALYVPVMGVPAAHSFAGDLIVSIYLLSLLTLSVGLAGSITASRFSLVGATRALTQLFAYEAPFMLALFGPAVVAGSWEISEIAAYAAANPWFLLLQPIGFIVAMVGLMGKLELPPFDAPEAETEIVAGPLTEYSGRGLALFHLARYIELLVGLSLIAAFYLGGVDSAIAFFLKTLSLLAVLILLQTLMT